MKPVKPIYVFDLDGTIALIEHRLCHIKGPVKDWKSFFAACIYDTPNEPVVAVLQALHQRNAEIWVVSGRSDEVRDNTVNWLFRYFIPVDYLFMRTAGDHQPDTDLKASWLATLAEKDRKRIAAVFDDRKRLVDMWRAAGLVCFQVAAGEF